MMTTKRTAIRRRLAIGRTAHGPPWGGRKVGHGSIVAPLSATVAASLAIGARGGAGARRARAARGREAASRATDALRCWRTSAWAKACSAWRWGSWTWRSRRWRARAGRPARSGGCTRRARRSSACARCWRCCATSWASRRTRARARWCATTGRRLARARDAEVLLATLDGLVERQAKAAGRAPRRAAPARAPGAGARRGGRAGAGRQRDARGRAGRAARAARARRRLAAGRAGRHRSDRTGAGAPVFARAKTHATRSERARCARAQAARMAQTGQGSALCGGNARPRRRRLAAPAQARGWQVQAPPRGRREGGVPRRAGQARATSSANCSARSTTWRCSRSACARRPRPARASGAPGKRSCQALLKAIARRRRRLRKRALRDGKRLYARKRKSFVRRVRAATALAAVSRR